MRITIEPTEQICDLGGGQLARAWKGKTERGVECTIFISLVRVASAADNEEFERELQELPAERAGRSAVHYMTLEEYVALAHTRELSIAEMVQLCEQIPTLVKRVQSLQDSLKAIGEHDKLQVNENPLLNERSKVQHAHNLFDCRGCQADALRDDLLVMARNDGFAFREAVILKASRT